MSEDVIGYEALTQDALRSVVRSALQIAAGARGLPGRHHFYLTFRTKAAGVILPDHLAQRYPEEMTIVLEHQYWDLEVFQDRFRVVLKFGGQPFGVVVPFAALTRFFDPSVRFGLQFDSPEETLETLGGSIERSSQNPPSESVASGSGAVVSIDAFRKK